VANHDSFVVELAAISILDQDVNRHAELQA